MTLCVFSPFYYSCSYKNPHSVILAGRRGSRVAAQAARICQRLAGAICWRNDFFNPCDRFMANWFVYLLRCADDSLYTGITTDLKRRVAQHNCGARTGAHYTRSRRPVTLVYHECWESRSAASKREHELRTLNKADKEQLAGSAASGQRR